MYSVLEPWKICVIAGEADIQSEIEITPELSKVVNSGTGFFFFPVSLNHHPISDRRGRYRSRLEVGQIPVYHAS